MADYGKIPLIPPSVTSSARDAFTNVPVGAPIWNTDTNRQESWDGTAWVGFLDSRGIVGSPLFGTFRWNAQRALAATQLVSVCVLGDSLCVGWQSESNPSPDTWWTISFMRRTIAALQAKYGDGGSGFVPCTYAQIPGGHNSTFLGAWATVTGAWTDNVAEANALNGHAIQPTVAGNGATITFPAVYGRYIQILTRQKTGFGTVTYNIDTGAQTGTITLNATPEGVKNTVVDTGGAGPHTITLTAATGDSRIYGVRGVNATGLVFDNFCFPGRRTGDLNILDAVQRISISGATGGTFFVGVETEVTTNLAFNISTANLQAALEALANVNKGDVAVSGSAGNYVLRWTGSWQHKPILPTVNGAALTGTTPTISIATQVDSVAVASVPGGVGGAVGGVAQCFKLSATGPTGTLAANYPALLINALGENDVTRNDIGLAENISMDYAWPGVMSKYGDVTFVEYVPPASARPDVLFLLPSFTGTGWANIQSLGLIRDAAFSQAEAMQGAVIDFDNVPSLSGLGAPFLNPHVPKASHIPWAAVVAGFLAR